MLKLYMDPGHGGSDPGAVANGLQEKVLTLIIAKKIRDELKNYEGVQVRLSRDSDETLSLSQRTNDANAWGADYLLSIHINAGGGAGFESYTYNGSYSGKSETNRLRGIVHDEIMDAIGGRDRGEKEANFHMVRESSMPALLTENLFIDNKEDAEKLKSDAFLDKIALGHVSGIVKAFGLGKASSKPEPKPESDPDDSLLKEGSRGSTVKERQKRLKELGYYTGRIDGIFGPLTESAVIKFQRDQGIAVDGIIGPITRSKLKSAKRKSRGIPVKGRIEIVNVSHAAYICDRPSSTDSKNLATIEKGKEINISGSIPGWWEVIYEGRRAYVNEKYGRRIK
ncbi:N-acetylmuramoyl-L-alanine amidase [Radiobacillus kanasensis]|uniref:N-acetylmuramoyl-L-alanine amidase n=1 Tax=Radiobacillus kanasensis TaxID=2844358 RepID=UPI001E5CF927|nr:N-acetylmuramoyl-L-alanine amidase [Radiobacillus kanasensis]UFT98078.1 N-acetylmuramoyl-L-alanine amidase [Radiobacillus kanasensis]